MNECVLSNEQLLNNLGRKIKECKLFQLYFEDVTDDYAKLKMAKLRFEFARHEYFQLLNEAKSRGLKVGEEEKGIARLLFH